jgi:hypothetical protein
MAYSWYPYMPATTNYTGEGRSGTPKGPMGSLNHKAIKPSLNPQIVKQLTVGRMGRMTCSSTFLIPHPRSYMALQAPLLSAGWVVSLLPDTHTGTQCPMLSTTTQPSTFTLKCQGNLCLCISRTQGFYCSMGNWRCRPTGLVPPYCQQQLYCTLGSLHWQAGSRYPQALFFSDCSSSFGSWKLALGKQTPELLLTTDLDHPCLQQLLCLLVVCASKQAPGLLLPKGLDSLCQQYYYTAFLEPTLWQADLRTPAAQKLTWIPFAWSNCHGFWQPMPASRPQGSCCPKA